MKRIFTLGTYILAAALLITACAGPATTVASTNAPAPTTGGQAAAPTTASLASGSL
jgi:uncharacterized lipoprotein YajG